MLKFKIFFGNDSKLSGGTADDKANAWLKENPDVEIIDMKYQQSRFGDHSICIMYKENEND